MTEKQIEKKLNDFRKLPYSLQYYFFTDFIKRNIEDADFFVTEIEYIKENY